MEISKKAKELVEEIDSPDYITEEVAQAYIECVGEEYATAEDLEESYSGQFSSDEEFAQNMAESIGAMPNTNEWPHYCIDWEFAARELMMNYSEHNGYYFRNN